jgi:hypothetical protein
MKSNGGVKVLFGGSDLQARRHDPDDRAPDLMKSQCAKPRLRSGMPSLYITGATK